MALETLKSVDFIDGENVIHMDSLREKYPERFNESGSMDHKWFEETIRPNHFIYVRHDVNSLSFTLQNGPIKEVGKNGCQVDHIIGAAKTILEGLNKQFPCRENSAAITKLDEALHWLEHRRKNREKAGVEGLSKAIPETKKEEVYELQVLEKKSDDCYVAELCPYKSPEQIDDALRYIKRMLDVTAHSVREPYQQSYEIRVYTGDLKKLAMIEQMLLDQRLIK